MSQPVSVAARHWARILRRWPADRMRPQWVAVQTVMQKRLDSRLRAPATTPSEAATGAENNNTLGTAVPTWNEAKEMQQTNSLYSLLEDRYMKEYPLPETLRYPQSQPEHYDVLLREFEEAPDRSWLERLWLRIRGSVRMQ